MDKEEFSLWAKEQARPFPTQARSLNPVLRGAYQGFATLYLFWWVHISTGGVIQCWIAQATTMSDLQARLERDAEESEKHRARMPPPAPLITIALNYWCWGVSG